MAFKGPRWTAINTLPVLFVMTVIFSVYAPYAWEHLGTLLSDPTTRQRGIWQAVVLHIFAILSWISFALAVFTDPGSVPDTPEWQREDATSMLRFSFKAPLPGSNGEQVDRRLTELKQTGARRFCKWCNHFKPDRCHHCRVCRSCVLRMDHHCPWIANCVGFRNQKYFFLLVLHSMLSCVFIITTMAESWKRAVKDEMSPIDRFLIVYGMTIAVVMTTLLVPFFLLHCSFMFRAVTTIEHCEKRTKRVSSSASFDAGVFGNMKAVLGPNVLLWLLPVSLPEGDGLFFETQASRALRAKTGDKGTSSGGGAGGSQGSFSSSRPGPVFSGSAPAAAEAATSKALLVAASEETQVAAARGEEAGGEDGAARPTSATEAPVRDAVDADHAPEVTGSPTHV